MINLKQLILPVLVLLFTGCSGQGATELNADDFEKGIARKGIQLVDVRTPQEHEEKFIPKSQNIDFNNEATFEAEFLKLDKNKPLYLYCLSGGRSSGAGVFAVKHGFKEVYNLNGGILAWINKGKPIETRKNVPAAGGMTFEQYLERVKKPGKLVMVDFTAVWCGPCKILKPVVEKVVKENKDKVELFAVDIDRNAAVANTMHIQSIPLLVLYKDGKEVWRNLGLTDETTIANAVKKHLK